MTQPRRPVPEMPVEELQVLAAAAGGETVAQTSRRLEIAVRTIHRLRTRAVKRLGARSAVHAVALAADAGLITVEPAGGGEGDG